MGRARICRASCDWYVLARTGVQSVRLCHMGTDVSDGLNADVRIFWVFSNRLPELTFAVTALWHPGQSECLN